MESSGLSKGLRRHEGTEECIGPGGSSNGRSGGRSVWTVVVVMRVTTLKATAHRLDGLLAYYAGLAEDREQPGPA